MTLAEHVARFSAALADFGASLPPEHAAMAAPLNELANTLPGLVRGSFVRRDTALDDALGYAGAVLGVARLTHAAPARTVARLERRLYRLFDVGVAVEPHRRRPRRAATLRPSRARFGRHGVRPGRRVAHG